jgi:hypothetical protein
VRWPAAACEDDPGGGPTGIAARHGTAGFKSPVPEHVHAVNDVDPETSIPFAGGGQLRSSTSSRDRRAMRPWCRRPSRRSSLHGQCHGAPARQRPSSPDRWLAASSRSREDSGSLGCLEITAPGSVWNILRRASRTSRRIGGSGLVPSPALISSLPPERYRLSAIPARRRALNNSP